MSKENVFALGDGELRRCLEFTIEIDKMKTVIRRSLIYDGTRCENDAEHSWHIAMMAVIFEKYAVSPVNLGRVLEMLLVHDLVEVYAGDTFAFDKTANEDKHAREMKAADKIFSMTDSGREMRALWEEFDRADTPDSLYAAALDRLQPFLSNYLNAGGTWALNGVKTEAIYERMDPIRRGIPALWELIVNIVDDCTERGYIG